jgi:hypothetical protein
VLCKELFHVILDQERYRTIQIFDHLVEVMASPPIHDDAKSGIGVISENMAEISAMQYMLPYVEPAPSAPDKRMHIETRCYWRGALLSATELSGLEVKGARTS